MDTENPLEKLGELTKPATVLIEKISDAVGGAFRPYQIIRVAKAEAEADRIRAESRIQITELERRAMQRFFGEEAQKQSIIEGITQKALPLLMEESTPQDVSDDWITNFFDKCRIVRDEDMQKLWSTVLAGEANVPGAFSKRTVNLLADLDKADAELFIRLCGFGWKIGECYPLVYDVQDEIYNRRGIHFSSLSHLESLGLVQFDNLSGFQRVNLPKKFVVEYFGKTLELTFSKDSDNVLSVGNVLLTRAGRELSRVCGTAPVDGFFDFMYEWWAAKSLVPSKHAQPDGDKEGAIVAA